MRTNISIQTDKTASGRGESRIKKTDDLFYSESNMAHLMRGVAALNAGKGVEHDLIQVTDE